MGIHRQIFRATIVPIGLVALWELLSRTKAISPQVLPPPSLVAVKWLEYLLPREPFDPSKSGRLVWLLSGELPTDAAASLLRVVAGFLIGAALALPLGLLMGAQRSVYALLNPLIQLLRPIPPIAFIPLSILWFGLGNPPALFLISLGALFPILINTVSGVRNVDSLYIRAARNLGARGFSLFYYVLLPAALPQILAGIRVGIGVAFMIVIVAEMIAVNNGLGYRLLEAREFFWSDKIIAGMLTIGVLGLLLDGLVSRLNRHLLRWNRSIENASD